MACNHKKRTLVASGRWLRKRELLGVIRYDDVQVLQCEWCGAIRIDTSNEFCFSQGRWSMPIASLAKNIKIKK